MNNFEVVVTWENVNSSYTPTGWSHSKKDFSYNKQSKFFNRFIEAMNYIRNVETKNNVVGIVYINHKTGETKKY